MRKNTKEVLKNGRINPNKWLGQNFLISRQILEKIIASADLKKSDIVLEIGPGTGILTKELAKYVKKVIAIEKDKKMVDLLRESLKSQDVINVEVILDDILNPEIISYIRKKFVFRSQYKLVANLPYYISAPVIRKFLEIDQQPLLMILMLQKEVAEKICAKPPKMSKLSVFTQFYAEPKIITKVSKSCFWPQPKVDSAIIKITPKHLPENFLRSHLRKFEEIVIAGFNQPRKQLLGNLSKQLNLPRERTEKWLQQNNIAPTRRAETLSIQNWINLTNTFTF